MLLEKLTASVSWRFALSSISIYIALLCVPILLIPAPLPLPIQNTTKGTTGGTTEVRETFDVTTDDEKEEHCSMKISKDDKDKVQNKDQDSNSNIDPKITLLQALMTKQIITLALAYCLFLIAALGIFGHLAAFYTIAFSSSEAAMIVSIVGIAQIIGRPLFGLLADRLFGNRLTLAFCSLHVGLSLLCWTSSGTSLEIGILWALNFGISFGGYWAVVAGAVHENMPDEYFAKGFGIIVVVAGLPGTMFSSSIFGYLKETTGTYMTPSILSASLLLVGTVVVLVGGDVGCQCCTKSTTSPNKVMQVENEILTVVQATACESESLCEDDEISVAVHFSNDVEKQGV